MKIQVEINQVVPGMFRVVCNTGFTLVVTASSTPELVDKTKAVITEAKQQLTYKQGVMLRAYRKGKHVPWSQVAPWVAAHQNNIVSLPNGSKGYLKAFAPNVQKAAALYYLKGGRLGTV